MSSVATAKSSDLKARADALLAKSFDTHGPGVAVAISRHGHIIYQGERGEADIATKSAVVASTVFRLGSITKQFVAAVVLQLVAEAKMGLDDPLSKYVPDYPNGNNITIRELLNHTSGVQDYTDIPGFMVEGNTSRPYTTAQLISVFRNLPPDTKPGTAWAYDNSGYVLVAAVIEAVTKQPWYVEVERRIATPLGLHTIRYGREEASIPAMAKGYTTVKGRIVPAQSIDMSVASAAGGLVGDAPDLVRWGDALHHGRVVTPALYAQMTSPTKLPDGTTASYGLGLMTETIRGLPAIGHSGGIYGFITDSVYVPQDDVFVTVLANSDKPQTSPARLMRRLAAIAVNRPYPNFTPHKLDVTAVRPFLGTYRIAGKERVLNVQGGKLVYRQSDDAEALVPVGGNRYAFGADGVDWIELRRDADGTPAIVYFDDGSNSSAPSPKIGPVPAASASPAH